jgi:hypothetical protein
MDDVKPGTVWRHRNGNLYCVMCLANSASTSERYPVTVVYMGTNGLIWSRQLSDWHRSMTLETADGTP